MYIHVTFMYVFCCANEVPVELAANSMCCIHTHIEIHFPGKREVVGSNLA